jgi:hypothetical protein
MIEYTAHSIRVAVYGPRVLFVTYTGPGFYMGHMIRVTGDDAEVIGAAAAAGDWRAVWPVLRSVGMGYLPAMPLAA